MYHEKTKDAASGKWKGILLELGVSNKYLTGKHTPCPFCGGEDRFRFDNKRGSGSFICNSCGAGDGLEFAKRFTDKSFVEVASHIDQILGNIKIDADPVKRDMSDEQRKAMLRRAYGDSVEITPGCKADKYLTGRGLGRSKYPPALRYAESLADGEGAVRPCMLAIVSDADGKPCTMHRTFLNETGSDKAEMGEPRKMMPGEIPEGAAVRLFPWTGGPLGVAEGVETALAAARLFRVPVWAVLNATMLRKWIAPEGASVIVFGDNDTKYGGQASAYEIANKMACKGFDVRVMLPFQSGEDWNDVLRCYANEVSHWPEALAVEYAEIAASIEYDGGKSREIAEREAFLQVVGKRL